MTQLSLSASIPIKVAAYLEAYKRLDATPKTRRGRLKCKPPNQPCGSRCIPPSWDCRLKNEGADPHLNAVKTDPLGAAANIERGLVRLTKGVSKGSFSDVEGGKRSIIRGVVKATPGNLQDKANLRSTLEKNTVAIGIGLAVVTGGIGIHSILMKSNTFNYRNTIGKNVNEAVRKGVSVILDNIPVIGAERKRTRQATTQIVNETVQRTQEENTAGPDKLATTLGRGGETILPSVNIGDRNSNSRSNLMRSINEVNKRFKSNSGDVYAWDIAHRRAFWGASIKVDDLGPEIKSISVFARSSGEQFLSRQFGLNYTETTTKAELKSQLMNKLDEERLNLVALAKQQGYRTIQRRDGREHISSDDLNPFVRDVIERSGTTQGPLRRSIEEHTLAVLTKARSTYANELYKDSILGFNKYYKTLAQGFDNVAGAAVSETPKGPRVEGVVSPLTDEEANIRQAADSLRIQLLIDQMKLKHPLAGPAHASLIKKAYFATRVVGSQKSTYSITPREAQTAAKELSGNIEAVIAPDAAYRMLIDTYGFTGLTRVNGSTPPSTPPSAPPTSPPNGGRPPRRRRSAPERSYEQIVEMLVKGGMSRKRAEQIAKDVIAKRNAKNNDSDTKKDAFDAWMQSYVSTFTKLNGYH